MGSRSKSWRYPRDRWAGGRSGIKFLFPPMMDDFKKPYTPKQRRRNRRRHRSPGKR